MAGADRPGLAFAARLDVREGVYGSVTGAGSLMRLLVSDTRRLCGGFMILYVGEPRLNLKVRTSADERIHRMASALIYNMGCLPDIGRGDHRYDW